MTLRQVSHLRCAIALISLEAILCRDKVTALQAALDEVHIPSFVQDIVMPAGTLEDYAAAAELIERGLDLV